MESFMRHHVLVLQLLLLNSWIPMGVKALVGSSGQALSEFTGWSDYIKAWENENVLRSQRMYPFAERFGDTRITISGVSLRESFQFYAVRYRSLFISEDGHFRFSTLDTAPESRFKNQLLPNSLYPDPREGDDPPMAAIFYAPHDYRSRGFLNYRTLHKSSGVSPKERIETGMLEQLSAHVQKSVVGADRFHASRGIIATWENVTFTGLFVPPGQGDRYPENTYQMVMVTDDEETYVVLNYFRVDWAGSTSMGCNSRTGLRSDGSLDCRGAQIGFNVGEGRHFWSMPYSTSTKVVDLDMEDQKGSDVRGRFFYKVSNAFIVRGGCTKDLQIAGPNWPLAISPTSGGMFGGYDVNISAPCFGNGDRIQCRFGDVVTDGVYDGNVMKARCPAPMLKAVGQVNVSVSIDGGVGYPFSTMITIGLIGYTPAGVQVEPPVTDWLNVDKFDLKWDPKAITWRDVDFVDILMYGYKENPLQPTPTWRLLKTLASRVSNQGFFTVHTNSQQCGEGMDAKTDCTGYAMGIMVVTISGSDPASSPTALLSEPLPLGWFIRTAAPKYLGTNWAHEMCRYWHGDDIKVEKWEEGLPVCPCTLGQALSDWGRFVTDIYCQRGSAARSDNCQRHMGAVHCVISTQFSAKGSGSHCCYDNSDSLIYSGDSQYGSAPYKAHPWGVPPYGRTPYIPSLSNWFWDIAPFYTCCEWQTNEYDCFNMYVARRTTPSCQAYLPPRVASAFGDPHYLTFDGVAYTYNGKGEFWLLHTNQVSIGGRSVEFALQARFEQPKTPSGLVPKATTITSVSMQETVGGTPGGRIEIQRNNYAPYDRLLLVYVNSELLDFRDVNVIRQDFPDFVIINNDPPNSKVVHGNFTAVFRVSGVGIQVSNKNGLIHVMAVVPPEFKGKTEGLLGTWDDIADNDIQPRGGGQFVNPSDTKRIHELVGISWQIGQSESRFTYWARLNRDYYFNGSFTPVFSPTFPPSGSSGVTPGEVSSVCGSNIPCQFDYMVTLERQVAEDTLNIQAWTTQQSARAKSVATCGYLNIAGAMKRQPLKDTPGSVVNIDGCRSGFKLEGTTRYTCVGQGLSAKWSPDASNTKCVDQTDVKEAQTQLAVAIGVPAGIVLLLIIIGIIGLLCFLSRKRRERKEKENPPDELMHMPRGDFHASDLRPELDPDIKKPTKNIKKPRPDYKPNYSQSQDDLSTYALPRIPSKPMSSSLDNLDKDATLSSVGKDSVDLNSTLQSATSSQKPSRPYHYPRNTETLGERKRAPYGNQYAHHKNDDFTPEERALIEARTRMYND